MGAPPCCLLTCLKASYTLFSHITAAAEETFWSDMFFVFNVSQVSYFALSVFFVFFFNLSLYDHHINPLVGIVRANCTLCEAGGRLGGLAAEQGCCPRANGRGAFCSPVIY